MKHETPLFGVLTIKDPLKIFHLHFRSLDSTQDYIKRESSIDPNLLFCVSADEQTNGHGQNEKKWISPAGKNLYISFHFITDGEHAHNLAQLLSISCMKLFPDLPFLFKWPNDLLMNGKKIAGCLSEVVSGRRAIVGLGLNVLMTSEECSKIDQKATSLFIETGTSFDIQEIRDSIAIQFQADLMLFFEKGFSPFHSFIDKHLAYKGQIITINRRKTVTKGLLLGIHEDGSLSLKKESGEIETYFSGSLECYV